MAAETEKRVTFHTTMTAGAIAGIVEHSVMYPLDSVKTRMQSLSPLAHSDRSISGTFHNMVKNEGVFRPIRGLAAVIMGAGPGHALYFGSYELSKQVLAHYPLPQNFNYLASAVMATLVHATVTVPTDMVKQRLQMYNSQYNSVFECMRGVLRREGATAFYRSYPTYVAMNIPQQAVHFVTYEYIQNWLNKERRYNPPLHVIAGGTAGALASAVTTPMDVVKTVLNTQETGITRSMASAAYRVYALAGIRGFFRGITARVLYAMPATAICWSTYEYVKFKLSELDNEIYQIPETLSVKDVKDVKEVNDVKDVKDANQPKSVNAVAPYTKGDLVRPTEESSSNSFQGYEAYNTLTENYWNTDPMNMGARPPY